MIQTILWDVDGTLLNFKLSEKVSFQKALQSIGYTRFDDEFAARYSAINQSFWEMLERGEITKPKLLTARFDKFFAEEGIDYTDTEDFNRRYHENLSTYYFVNDNSIEVLKGLKNRYKQYVVTNGTANVQDKKLVTTGISEQINGIFISERVGAEKPSIEFFEKVRSATGYNPETTVIIGDSLTSDMKGGNNAGIRCWWYSPSGDKAVDGIRVDRIIKDLGTVPALLEQENRDIQ